MAKLVLVRHGEPSRGGLKQLTDAGIAATNKLGENLQQTLVQRRIPVFSSPACVAVQTCEILVDMLGFPGYKKTPLLQLDTSSSNVANQRRIYDFVTGLMNDHPVVVCVTHVTTTQSFPIYYWNRVVRDMKRQHAGATQTPPIPKVEYSQAIFLNLGSIKYSIVPTT